MYRSYRIGDLPDIQIKHSFIIAPLQGLAQVTIEIYTILISQVLSGAVVCALSFCEDDFF